MILAQRTFNLKEQWKFAEVTGDRNPMHLDPIAARRTQAGSPVVHGMHLLLWTLDALAVACPDLPALGRLQARFNRFVHLNEVVEAILVTRQPKSFKLSVHSGASAVIDATIDIGAPLFKSPVAFSADMPILPVQNKPLELALAEMVGQAGRLSFATSPKEIAEIFPAAAAWLGPRRVAALGAATDLVGMICPGLHSIFSGLTLQAYDEDDAIDALSYRVTNADERFRRVRQTVAGGGLAGTLESYVRPRPTAQPTMAFLKERVSPSEFKGSTALVIGGSRGIGELTAKLIAAGGGRVFLSYRIGQSDAEKVAEEIRLAGGECEPLEFNVLKSPAEQLAGIRNIPSHLYYFATPAIFRARSEIFSEERLSEFLQFYVTGFDRIVRELRNRRPDLVAFYPSTVSLNERPRGMTEYTMAKSAGEILCEDINQYLAPLRIIVKRLPRIATDQTASIIDAETADPLEAILPIVREVQGTFGES